MMKRRSFDLICFPSLQTISEVDLDAEYKTSHHIVSSCTMQRTRGGRRGRERGRKGGSFSFGFVVGFCLSHVQNVVTSDQNSAEISFLRSSRPLLDVCELLGFNRDPSRSNDKIKSKTSTDKTSVFFFFFFWVV